MIKTATDNTLINNFNEDYNYCSWFNKISSCLMKSKVEEILKATLNRQNARTCIDIFREDLREICNYRISNIEDYREIIIEYADSLEYMWYRYTHDVLYDVIEIANDFINSIANGSFYTFFEVKYIGRKRIKGQEGNRFPNNLIFNFNFDIFLALTSKYEEMYAYETVYRHLFMLVYLLELIKNTGIDIYTIYKDLFPVLKNNINSTVLTGMEAFAEFDLGYPYVMLFDELRHLTPESKQIFTYRVTPDNLSITCKIKDYLIISKKFSKYLRNTPIDVISSSKEKGLDTATSSELRIIEGSAPDKMKVIVNLSGQRIINRLFSLNGNVTRNMKTHKLDDYIYLADNFVAFTLWVVMNSTKESKQGFENVKTSALLPYIQYVNKEAEHRQRGIVPVTAIAILLSKMNTREREIYLRNNFNNNATQQRAFIRRSILKIKTLQIKAKNKEPLVAKLVKEIKHAYKW